MKTCESNIHPTVRVDMESIEECPLCPLHSIIDFLEEELHNLREVFTQLEWEKKKEKEVKA